MKRHTIIVKVSGNRVQAESNPQAVDPGDVVTWLVANAAAKDLRVVFTELQGPTGMKAPIPPLGPFYELLTGSDRIIGQVSDQFAGGRFIYEIRAGENTTLDWDNPMKGKGGGNFGGIDIPRPPGG